MTKLFRQKNI